MCVRIHHICEKKGEHESLLIIILYLYDLIFTGSSREMMEDFKVSMRKELAMTDLGSMSYFLGVEVIQNSQGIFICPSKYANEVLDRFDMNNGKPIGIPIVHGFKLSKQGEGGEVDVTNYKQIVGNLMYLTTTRSDLM